MLGVGAIIELLTVHISLLWKIKLISASLVTVSIGMYTGYSVANGLTSIGLLLLLLNTFRLFNVIKFARPNIHPHYLRSVTKRSSNIFSIILFGLLILQNSNIILGVATISVWAILLFCISLATLAITAKNLQKTQHHKSNHYFSDKELPTVTVAIPARNETDDLASCIRTILANDYPKLEILVYDDCSYDRTAEIIRDFAHDGVRFISGLPPEDRWLAKNKAYDTLYDNASGEIV